MLIRFGLPSPRNRVLNMGQNCSRAFNFNCMRTGPGDSFVGSEYISPLKLAACMMP